MSIYYNGTSLSSVYYGNSKLQIYQGSTLIQGANKVLRQATTRAVMTSGAIKLGGAADGNRTDQQNRLYHKNGPNPIDTIQLAVPRFWMATIGGEAALDSPYTVGLAVEYNGQTKVITWDGGSLSKLISISATKEVVYSDETPLGFTIPADAVFQIRHDIKLISGNWVYVADKKCHTSDFHERSTDTGSQLSGTGTMSVPSGGVTSNLGGVFAPTLILSRVPSTAKGAILLGDSIQDGTNDTAGDGLGNAGWASRACYIGNGTGQSIPYARLARPSETASNMVAGKGDVRKSLFQWGNVLVNNFGTNDIGFASSTLSASPQSKTTVLANLKTNTINGIWTPAKAAGLKVYQALLTPRVLGPIITSITNSGTTATVTTADTSMLSVNQSITVVAVQPAAYRGTFLISEIVSPTQFRYVMLSDPGTSGSLQTGQSTTDMYFHDGYKTTALMRPVDCWEPGGIKDQWNDWLFTKVADGTIDGVIDYRDAIMEKVGGVYTGKWLPGATSYASDGLHPGAVGASAMAAVAAPILWAA